MSELDEARAIIATLRVSMLERHDRIAALEAELAALRDPVAILRAAAEVWAKHDGAPGTSDDSLFVVIEDDEWLDYVDDKLNHAADILEQAKREGGE